MTLLETIESFPSLRVAVVGDAMLDRYIIGDVHRISPEAPVPVVLVDREVSVPGGAANVASNIISLGGKCQLIAPNATDANGVTLKHQLDARGVGTSGMWPCGSVTPTKTRVMAGSTQVCRIDHESNPEGRAMNLDARWDVTKKILVNSDACIISDYGKGAMTKGLMDSIRDLRRSIKMFVAMDPCIGGSVSCSYVDLLTPNLMEAERMTSAKPGARLEEIFSMMQELHMPMNLAVTLGSGGIAVGRNGVISDRLPTAAMEVFDVSGAGDTVIAVMTLAMAAGATLPQAAVLANLAAGCVVSRVGTTPVSIHELRRALEASEWVDK